MTMAAYVIFDIDVHDAEGYQEYRRLGAPTLARYGGRFLVRGGAAENLEGEWMPKRVIVIEFDSARQAREWHRSTEYQAAKAIRDRTARSIAIVVDGV
jgi:uncharacterized protein (DUF1330 family)